MHLIKYAKALSISWAIILAVLMLLPQDTFPESKLLSYDKLAHVIVFGLLSFLTAIALLRSNVKNTTKVASISLTICLVYSSVLEIGQIFVPGRMFDGYDFFANFTGGLVGVIFFSIFIRQKFVIDKLIL